MTLTPEEKAGCLFANQKLALAIPPYFFKPDDRPAMIRTAPFASKAHPAQRRNA